MPIAAALVPQDSPETRAGVVGLPSSKLGLLNVIEVAGRLGVSPVTVYRLCERGALLHVRLSNSIRAHPEDLEASSSEPGDEGEGI